MSKHKVENLKPWYKRWWAIVLFVFIGFYIIGLMVEEAPTNETNQNVNVPSVETNDNSVIVQQPKQEEKTLIKEIVSEDKTLEEYQIGKFTRDFEWDYNGNTYQITLNLYPEVYKIFKQRERTRDYDLFASDFYSKEYIKAITEGLRDYGKENGLSDAEVPYFIISFVQNLPYTSDDVTTGFDEYPRFPYETFYDNGGDCEDTSILASAMLHELGYGVVLLQFPEHMAVGVKCSPSVGQSYYTSYGIDYCYLETTGQNWEVGAVPPNIKSSKAIIKPLVERPALQIEFTSRSEGDWKYVYTDVDVEVKNLGSETAKNTKIYVALQTTDTSKVWAQIQSDSLEIEPEEIYSYKVTNLHSSTGQPFRIYVRAWGDNVISDESVSNWIYLK